MTRNRAKHDAVVEHYAIREAVLRDYSTCGGIVLRAYCPVRAAVLRER